MDKNEKVKQLYSKVFSVSPQEWEHEDRPVGFICPYAGECRVDLEKEAVWSPALGDPDNYVMIVAEAPSTARGTGAHLGGLTRDWSRSEKGGVGEFLHFVRTRFKSNPHFTDVMKCGVAEQTRERKQVFKRRTETCVKQYLLQEVRIVNPKLILCAGARAWQVLTDFQKRGEISRSIRLKQLLHYSGQAGLPLTSNDKTNIIWPIQLGDLGSEAATQLSYLKGTKDAP